MAKFANQVYNTLFKRNSIFVTTVFTTAFFFGIGFDVAVSKFYDRWNQGKQWKDIRHRYVQEE